MLGAKASKNATFTLFFLSILKGIVGFYSGSAALIADAIHTSLDIFTSLAVWIGLKLSLKGSEEKFPYGYYKADNLVSLFVSIIILFSGFELVREALLNITNPVEVKMQGIALGTAVFSVVVMYALSQYKFKVGKQIDSQALIADALHSYTDVFSSLIVAITIIGSVLGVLWLDSVGVLVISLMIFKLGIGIAKDSIMTLMDAWLDKDSIRRIRQNVGSIQGVKTVGEIRLRKSGLVVFGEIEIEIEGDANLKRVEMLSEEIEKIVENEVKNLEHLVVNAKPGKMSVMKIAVPILMQEGLHSKISRHFGKAPYFIFIELEDSKIKSWDISENPASDLEKKRGLKTTEFLKNRGINVLIVGEIGESPFHNLHDSFVKMLQMPEAVEDVEKVVEKISELGTLTEPTE
ncbi:cation diffusion facilitator family transporter [Methanosarcina sp. WWM596]|uniref:cation diffusion facilitator family transporter n=1 Tax=Methanosarcina sp. WWM596 TaxID=1434103 RepID=UPI000615B9DB|nr:cation diffusion facilitator family transporter [Methanosarcina sp. WWM596]AKB18411.1 Cobalt-zinc-cadmium resistance protein [Methanosarcina sp. WWM596]